LKVHRICVILNRRFEQPGLFPELASLPNLERIVTKKLMVTLIELHDHIWRWEKLHCNTPPIWALWQRDQTQASPQWRRHTLGICKKHLNDSLRLGNIIFWSDETRHCSSTVKCSGGKIMAYGQLCECP